MSLSPWTDTYKTLANLRVERETLQRALGDLRVWVGDASELFRPLVLVEIQDFQDKIASLDAEIAELESKVTASKASQPSP